MHNTVQKYTHIRHKKWKEELHLGINLTPKYFLGLKLTDFTSVLFNTFVGKNSLVILNQGNIQFYNKNWPLYDSHSIMKLVIHTICFHLICF